MKWTKGEPEPAISDAILVTQKEHGVMLATWQGHRGDYAYTPFFHSIVDGTITRWVKVA